MDPGSTNLFQKEDKVERNVLPAFDFHERKEDNLRLADRCRIEILHLFERNFLTEPVAWAKTVAISFTPKGRIVVAYVCLIANPLKAPTIPPGEDRGEPVRAEGLEERLQAEEEIGMAA